MLNKKKFELNLSGEWMWCHLSRVWGWVGAAWLGRSLLSKSPCSPAPGEGTENVPNTRHRALAGWQLLGPFPFLGTNWDQWELELGSFTHPRALNPSAPAGTSPGFFPALPGMPIFEIQPILWLTEQPPWLQGCQGSLQEQLSLAFSWLL